MIRRTPFHRCPKVESGNFRGRGLLLQRLGELAGARLHLLEQPHVLDRDHRLVGEDRNEIDLLLGEWINRSPAQEQCADGNSLAQEWNAEYGAIVPAFLSFEPSEFRIGQNVWDVNNSAFEYGSPGDRPTIDLTHLKSLQVFPVVRLKARERDKLEAVVLETRYVCLIRVAKSCRRFDQRIEHGLQIKGRATNDFEHVSGSGLLLQRLAQVTSARLHFALAAFSHDSVLVPTSSITLYTFSAMTISHSCGGC
jgi:hypothetical protein